MPNLSPKEYAELQRLITGPDHGLTPEELERANAAVAGFNEQYETGMRGGLDPEAAMAMGPPTQADLAVSREIPGGEDLALKLDPAFPLLPQADATAPNTTHPGGDMQAAMEWMGGQPGGDVTFVYEPPLEVAQQKLLENPQLAATLFENLGPMSPEEIAQMQKGDDAYERVANRMWADTAKAAAESGKTVYRYSKTPWLHDGKMVNTLQKLGGFASVAPAAFIMGIDDTGFFGAGRALNEATAGDEANQAQAVADTNAPGAELAGQALGVLAPWTATSKLWNFIGSGGARIAGKVGGGLLARTGAAAGSAAVAAGADQAAREGAQALSGQGFDLGQSGARIGATMNPLESPLAPALGAAGELVGSVAKAGGDWTRDRAYGGSIGRMERNGTEFRFGRGPSLTPGAKEAVREGQALDADIIDAPAERLAPKLEEGAAKIRADQAEEIARRNQPFYESREGQMRLPATNTVQTVTEKLRKQFQDDNGRLRPIAGSGESVGKFRRILNEQIADVSTEPVEGAIELSADEAARFLSGRFKRKLVPNEPPPSGGSPPASGGGRRQEQMTIDVEPGDIEDVREAATVPPKGKAAKPAGKVAGPADRDITPTAHTPATNAARNDYGETMRPYREAQRGESRRMEKLAEEGSRGPVTTPPPSPRAVAEAELPSTEALKAKGLVPQHIDLQGENLDKAWPKEKVFFKTGKDGRKQAYTILDTNGSRGPEPLTHAKARELGLIGAAVAASAMGDEETPGQAAAVVGFASALKRRGHSKVYLVPRRYNAKDHETVIHNYNPEIRSKGPDGSERTFIDRDLAEIRDAAYRDREARPMNGVEGGWSEAQARAREQLKQAEDIQKRVGRGDQAFQSAVQYGNQGPGQLLNMRALQAAADKSGVRNQLDAARALDPWKKLQKAMTPGAATGDGNALGFTGAAMRLGHVAGAYPIAKGLESPLGPIRGGTAGRFSLLRGNKLAMPVEEEEQKP